MGIASKSANSFATVNSSGLWAYGSIDQKLSFRVVANSLSSSKVQYPPLEIAPVKSIGTAPPIAALDQEASRNSSLVKTKSLARDCNRGWSIATT